MNGQSECSEQITSSDDEGPVLEEFIPLKRASSLSQEEEDDEQQSPNKSTNHRIDDDDDNINNNVDSSDYSSKDGKNSTDDKVSKKQDWLRSAQLWNQPFTDPTPKEVINLTSKLKLHLSELVKVSLHVLFIFIVLCWKK